MVSREDKITLVESRCQKDIELVRELSRAAIELAEERSRAAIELAEERSKKEIETAKKEIELAEERSKKEIETAKKETAERFLMYGYAAEYQPYRKKLRKAKKMDHESGRKIFMKILRNICLDRSYYLTTDDCMYPAPCSV